MMTCEMVKLTNAQNLHAKLDKIVTYSSLLVKMVCSVSFHPIAMTFLPLD